MVVQLTIASGRRARSFLLTNNQERVTIHRRSNNSLDRSGDISSLNLCGAFNASSVAPPGQLNRYVALSTWGDISFHTRSVFVGRIGAPSGGVEESCRYQTKHGTVRRRSYACNTLHARGNISDLVI
jgi:hypothetical protein